MSRSDDEYDKASGDDLDEDNVVGDVLAHEKTVKAGGGDNDGFDSSAGVMSSSSSTSGLSQSMARGGKSDTKNEVRGESDSVSSRNSKDRKAREGGGLFNSNAGVMSSSSLPSGSSSTKPIRPVVTVSTFVVGKVKFEITNVYRLSDSELDGQLAQIALTLKNLLKIKTADLDSVYKSAFSGNEVLFKGLKEAKFSSLSVQGKRPWLEMFRDALQEVVTDRQRSRAVSKNTFMDMGMDDRQASKVAGDAYPVETVLDDVDDDGLDVVGNVVSLGSKTAIVSLERNITLQLISLHGVINLASYYALQPLVTYDRVLSGTSDVKINFGDYNVALFLKIEGMPMDELEVLSDDKFPITPLIKRLVDNFLRIHSGTPLTGDEFVLFLEGFRR
jgi:hypothetical protein